MKKILTASLVAMMAVTAARADIASTTYVTNKVSAVNTALGEYKTLNDAAVKKVGDDLAAETLRATGVEGGFATRIEALEAATGDGEGSVLADAKAYADQAEADAIAAAAEAAKIYIDETELNASQTAQDTTLKAYADDAAGAVSTALTNYQTTNDAAVKKVGDDLAAEVTARTTADTGLSGRIDVLEAASGVDGTTTKAIAAAQAAADKAQGEVDALETVVDGKQIESSAYSIGAANGEWSAFSAMPGYSASGTHTLSLVGGVPTWVPVVDAD